MFDSKAAMTKVFIAMCIVKRGVLTLMNYASESAPKIFFRSLNFITFHLNQVFFDLRYIVPDFIEKINKETRMTFHLSMISGS